MKTNKKKYKYKIAVIPGDGIGKEVTNAALIILENIIKDIDVKIDKKIFYWGSNYYRKYGVMMPKNGLEKLSNYDAILFGAVGDPKIPDDITLWGLRLEICQKLDQFANIRPSKYYPGIKSPLIKETAKKIDWIIVRENSEGEYSGSGGIVHKNLSNEIGTEISIFTKKGCNRIHEYAFRLAKSRKAKMLTLVTKSNAQRHGMKVWDKSFHEIKKKYPEIKTNIVLVDAATALMVSSPEKLDVIVATNLHADILSDLASALVGSLGLGSTANLSLKKGIPSMFEPIHGAAFDIMGKNIANPIGAILSCAMMMNQLGERKVANILYKLVEIYTSEGKCFTPDLGGNSKTTEVTKLFLKNIQKLNLKNSRLLSN